MDHTITCKVCDGVGQKISPVGGKVVKCPRCDGFGGWWEGQAAQEPPVEQALATVDSLKEATTWFEEQLRRVEQANQQDGLDISGGGCC